MTKTVLFHELGGPQVLRIEDTEVGEPGPDEIRIQVEAIGVNRAEALFRAGAYIYQPTFPASRIGYEASGTVAAVGEGVAGFRLGDPVCTVPGFLMNEYGTYGEEVIVPASAVIHRLHGIDPVSAAAIWMAHTTAYGLLVEHGRIRPGDIVLINAASSSVGVAAVQLANHLGAIPIAATRTNSKKQRLLKAGAAHVITTETEDLLQQARALTGNQGVSLALDAVAGPRLNTLVQAIAPGGTLLIYGFLDPSPMPLPIAADLRSRTIRTYAFFELTRDRPEQLRRAEHLINAGLRAGSLHPVIDATFNLDDIVKAHHRLESNTQVGKIVLTVPR